MHRHLVAVAFLLGALPVAAQTVTEHIAQGDSAQAAFQPGQALTHYEAALAIDSSHGEALRKASRSTVDLGEMESDAAKKKELFIRGASYARRAIAATPNDAEAHFDLARALGRAALAVGVRDRVRYAVDIRAHALQALAISPDHPGALHVMGVWNAEVMRLNGFERFFARNLLGGKVLGEANWKDAVRYMERAVEVDPDRLSHRLDLAKIYADTGEKAKARAQYEWVLQADRQTDVNDPLYKRQAEAELKRLK
jgi:tetratricopeptide (TPR) repeat protein